MIGYICHSPWREVPLIGVSESCYMYVYVAFTQRQLNLYNVYKVEFETTGELLKCVDGDAYIATKITYLELI